MFISSNTHKSSSALQNFKWISFPVWDKSTNIWSQIGLVKDFSHVVKWKGHQVWFRLFVSGVMPMIELDLWPLRLQQNSVIIWATTFVYVCRYICTYPYESCDFTVTKFQLPWRNFSCHFSWHWITSFTKFSWSPQVPTMFWVSVPTFCIYVSASVVRVLQSAPDNCHRGTCPFTQWVWNLDSQCFSKNSETHLSNNLFFAHSFNENWQFFDVSEIPITNDFLILFFSQKPRTVDSSILKLLKNQKRELFFKSNNHTTLVLTFIHLH